MQEEARATLTTHPSADHAPASTTVAGRSRLYAVLAATVVVTLVVDQVSKAWALGALTPGLARPLVGSWIQLRLIRNSGAAFSLGDRATWLLTILAVVIVVAILANLRRVRTTSWAVTVGLILGGALGNLVDRVVREPAPFRGHVVDFIDYFGLFIGNVADIAIVGAAGLVAWLTFREQAPAPPGEDTGDVGE